LVGYHELITKKTRVRGPEGGGGGRSPNDLPKPFFIIKRRKSQKNWGLGGSPTSWRYLSVGQVHEKELHRAGPRGRRVTNERSRLVVRSRVGDKKGGKTKDGEKCNPQERPKTT